MAQMTGEFGYSYNFLSDNSKTAVSYTHLDVYKRQSMECVPRHNTVDCPTLFWAAILGNEGDFPSEESFHTFIAVSYTHLDVYKRQALCAR